MEPPGPYGMTPQPYGIAPQPYGRHQYRPPSPTLYPPHLAAPDSHSYPQPPYDPFYHIPPSHTRRSPPNVAAVRFTPEQQRIHTLFIAGLPDDVKPREMHNLFRRRPGFESCQLEYTGRGDQVVAFVTFSDHHSAVAAMLDLADSVFDPYTGATLHIELARSNSRTKKRRGDGPYIIIDKRAKSEKNEQEASGSDGDGGSDNDNDNTGSKGAKLAKQSNGAPDKEDSQVAEDGKNDKAKAGDVPPCSTLFIANLGPNCTEEELQQVLSQCSGFQILKMRGRRRGMPVAFADFKDAESSTEAINSLQGKLLASSDRGGLHLEYARSKMKKT